MKNLLLAKSNIKKNLGLSICISLLIMISSMFVIISCLLVFDFDNNTYEVADELNTSDVSIHSVASTNNIDKINKEYLDSIMPNVVKEYEYVENLIIQTPIYFNDGEISPNTILINSKYTNRKISKIEIIEEDKTIKDNYIYVPYHIHSGGGINIGDTYSLKFPNKTYDFKVKGFIKNIYAGSYNVNRYEMIVSDKDYQKVLEENPDTKGIDLFINFKDDVDIIKESNKITNRIYIDTGAELYSVDKDTVITSRTFISSIFFVSFLLTAIIIIIIIMRTEPPINQKSFLL